MKQSARTGSQKNVKKTNSKTKAQQNAKPKTQQNTNPKPTTIIKTKSKNEIISKSTNTSNSFEDDPSFFKQFITNKTGKLILEKSKNKCNVIVWLDEIDNGSYLLTIFPSVHDSDFFNLPISAPVSSFPSKSSKLPFKLSEFGISDCDFLLNYEKS